ncbi:MAG TPA: hypothetical protein GX500_00625 [Firmicutes bacterium]|nr:hypothetical protein [Candidatus Fermentithermobacillaceae bacterium]
MNLLQALLQSSGERAKSIASFYGLVGPTGILPESASHEEFAKAIASHLLVPANTLVAMHGLDPEEMLALRLITIASGGSGVVIEQCHQKLNQLSRKWRRNGAKVIEALLSRGLVYIRKEGYRHIYYVPEDLRKVLSPFFLESVFKTTCADLQKFVPRHRSDVAAPLRHMALFLSYFRKHEVRVAQSGIMFKKAQNDLMALLGEENASIGDSLFAVRYPPRLAFLLYFAKSKGLVEERNGMIRLSSRAEAWVKGDCRQCRQELFDYWRQSFVVQDPDLQTMLWIIMHTPEDQAISLASLLEAMNTLSTSHSSHGLNLRAERNLVDTLEYLGGLEVAETLNGLYVRPTPLGRAMFGLRPWPEEQWDSHIYVQSNFEILVPCTVSPEMLWSIDAFAELLKHDQMMVYKLTRNSVYRAMLHSYTPETIEEFLVRHSKTPVAQNVKYSIAHWGTSYGRIEFEETILMKCDTEQLAEEIMLHPKIRPFIKQRVGPRYLSVDGSQYEQLVTVLSNEGYMPKVHGARKLSPQVVGQT